MAPAEPPDGPATEASGPIPFRHACRHHPPDVRPGPCPRPRRRARSTRRPRRARVACHAADPAILVPASLTVSSRRGFLRGALAVAGGTAAAAALAACAPAAGSAWSYAPLRSLTAAAGASEPSRRGARRWPSRRPGRPSPSPSQRSPASPSRRAGRSTTWPPARRSAASSATWPGRSAWRPSSASPRQDPEFTMVAHGNQPLEPTIDGDTKVFDLTIDQHRLADRRHEGARRGARLQQDVAGPGACGSIEGDKVRMNFTNNLDETTGVHMHGIEFDDFRMDGIPFVTQLPIVPGETFSYEFVARPSGSHMYHSHHNATDQVGRGLLGAFIVDPGRSGRALRRQVRRHAGVRLHPQRLAGRLHHQRSRLPGHRCPSWPRRASASSSAT